jgi:Arc/MetJ-type ribon-helix-helix transcriptional regulator
MAHDYTTVSIPSKLAKKIKKRLKGTGFRSMSEYVNYLLRQIETAAELHENKKAFTREDEEEVRKRLVALGYI